MRVNRVLFALAACAAASSFAEAQMIIPHPCPPAKAGKVDGGACNKKDFRATTCNRWRKRSGELKCLARATCRAAEARCASDRDCAFGGRCRSGRCDMPGGPDPICRQITSCAAAGGLGPYIDAVTSGCGKGGRNSGKRTWDLDSLDGLTFGLRHDWAENLGGRLQEYKKAFRGEFDRIFGRRGISTDDKWLMQQAQRHHGLLCAPGVAEAMHEALRQKSFFQVIVAKFRSKLKRAAKKAKKALCEGRGSSCKPEARVLLAWATMSNNLGSCSTSSIVKPCRNVGDQFNCILDRYLQKRCRGVGSDSRVRAIRRALEGLRGSKVSIPSTSTVMACVTDWHDMRDGGGSSVSSPEPVRPSTPRVSSSVGTAGTNATRAEPSSGSASVSESMGTITRSTTMRTGATSRSKPVRRLRTGTQVRLLGKQTRGWAQVSYRGKTGWVKRAKLRVSSAGTSASLPPSRESSPSARVPSGGARSAPRSPAPTASAGSSAGYITRSTTLWSRPTSRSQGRGVSRCTRVELMDGGNRYYVKVRVQGRVGFVSRSRLSQSGGSCGGARSSSTPRSPAVTTPARSEPTPARSDDGDSTSSAGVPSWLDMSMYERYPSSKQNGGKMRSPSRICGVILHEGFRSSRSYIARGERWHKHGISSHFAIAQDGTIYYLKDFRKQGVNAGCADRGTIGIDLNLGSNYKPKYPPAMMRSVRKLLEWLTSKTSIRYDAQHILGHAEAYNPRKVVDFRGKSSSKKGVGCYNEHKVTKWAWKGSRKRDPRGFPWAEIGLGSGKHRALLQGRTMSRSEHFKVYQDHFKRMRSWFNGRCE